MTTLNSIGTPAITLGGALTFSGAFATTITVTAGTTITLPTSGTLVSSSVTTLSSLVSIGTIGTGVWQGTVVGATYGGTGVNNGSSTITLAGNLVTTGANSLTLATTGSTSVTLPTSGTLCTTTGSSSIATVGTITAGTWNADVITGTYGGTGVNNGASTITIGGNVTFSGAHTFAATISGNTAVTFPTSGTLLTSTGTFSGVLQDYTETAVASNSGATYTIDMSTGNVFTLTLTASCTLSMSNVPAAGAASLTIIVVQGSGPYTITWPASFIWPAGTAPTLTTSNGHVDIFTAITTDAGVTFRAATAAQDFAS